MKNLFAILLSTAALSSAGAQNTFDGAADLGTQFVSTSNGSTSWAHIAEGGNTGGYISSGSSNFSGFNTQNLSYTLDLSADQTFTITVDFLTSYDLYPRKNYPTLSLGFTDSNPNTAPQSYAGGGLYSETSIAAGISSKDDGTHSGPTNQYGYHFTYGHSNEGAQITQSSVDDLNVGTWYQLEVIFTYTNATNNFTAETILKTADGSSIIRSVNFQNSPLANPWSAGETITVYPFFGGREVLNSGVYGVDNFMAY